MDVANDTVKKSISLVRSGSYKMLCKAKSHTVPGKTNS